MATAHPFVALVTGATRGIGLEFVRQLLAGRDASVPVSAGFVDPQTGKSDVPAFVPSNAVIIATARDPAHAPALAALAAEHPGRLHIAKLEASSASDIAALAQRVESEFGRLDLLVNNAGILEPETSAAAIDPEYFTRALAVNALAPIQLSSALLPLLQKTLKSKLDGAPAAVPEVPVAKGLPPFAAHAQASCTEVLAGARLRTEQEKSDLASKSLVKVVFVSSFLGSTTCTQAEYVPVYRASKAALNSLVRSFALSAAGIAVAPLHPGWVQTELGRTTGGDPPVTLPQSVAGMLDVVDRVSATAVPLCMASFDGANIPF